MEIRRARGDRVPAIAELYVSNQKEAYRGLLSDEYLNALTPERAAEKWAASGAVIGPARRGGAFLEHALQKLHERDDATRRAELEKWLADHDCPAEQVIATEHERQALERLQLDHMLAALRLLNGLDWSACFARVSRVERTLMKDPAGTYPRMENDSRDLARGRIADLAARCDVGEATFAAAALRAAERSEGIRREVCWWLMTDEGTRALLDGMGVKARGVPKIHPDPGARLTARARCCSPPPSWDPSPHATAGWRWPRCRLRCARRNRR